MNARNRVQSNPHEILNKAARKTRRALRRVSSGTTTRHSRSDSPTPLRGTPLPPGLALRENGFAVFRATFSKDECFAIAASLRSEASITDSVKYTKVDVTNSFPTARQMVLEGRILKCVRAALSPDARFLQVGDLHYLHDTAGWHRDSVHRAPDASDAPDWNDPKDPFGVVKAIVYLETQNAAMGMMAGSHLSPLAMDAGYVKGVEGRGGQLILDSTAEPNRRFGNGEKRTPLVWQADVGDVLVFDERMYHAGRRVDLGQVTAHRQAPKLTLSLVFGLDNHHSERMYSYFRFARKELGYRDLPPDFTTELADSGLGTCQPE